MRKARSHEGFHQIGPCVVHVFRAYAIEEGDPDGWSWENQSDAEHKINGPFPDSQAAFEDAVKTMSN